MKQLLLLLVTTMAVIQIQAQSLNIDSVHVTPSTCPNNGIINIYASGGNTTSVGLSYSILAPASAAKPYQNSNTFTALAAGSYTIAVIDNQGTIVQDTVAVTGNYTYPNITSLDITKSTCPGGSNASIEVNHNSGLTAPISYFLLDDAGQDTLVGPQSDSLFTNLSAGNYTVRIEDACDVVHNLGGIIPQTQLSNLNFITSVHGYSCDSSNIFPIAFNAAFPATIHVNPIQNPTAAYSYSYSNSSPTLKLANEPYELSVEDACGRKDTIQFTKPDFYRNNSQQARNCGTAISMNTLSTSCNNIEYCYKLTSDSVWTCSNSRTTPELPPGQYITKVINHCCNEEDSLTTTIAPSDTSITVRTYSHNYRCVDSTTTIQIQFKGRNNVNVIYKGSFSGTFTGTSQNNNKVFTPLLQVGDTMNILKNTTAEYFYLHNLPIGQYQFEYWDDCFPTPQTINIDITNVGKYNFWSDKILGCPGLSQLRVSLGAYPYYVRGNIKVTRQSDSSIVHNGYSNGRDTININSILPGDYEIEYDVNGLNTSTHNYFLDCPDPYIQNVNIPAYSTPDLSTSLTYDCGNSHTIVGNAVGIQPMLYSIREQGTTTFGPSQSSDLFLGLDTNKIYEVQAVDVCGNNSILAVSNLGVLSVPSISITDDCGENDSISSAYTLEATYVHNANYEWKNSAGQVVSTNQSLVLDPIVLDSYTVEVSLPGDFGIACQTSISSMVVSTVTCGIAAPLQNSTLQIFNQNCINNFSWKTYQERNTSHAILQRGTAPNEFVDIDRIEQQGNSDIERVYYMQDANIEGQNTLYYRIKFVDMDDAVTYSNIVMSKSGCSTSSEERISVIPNPTKGTINVSVPQSRADGQVNLKIMDISGREVFTVSKKYENEFIREQIDLSDLQNGVYFLIISIDNMELTPAKIQLLR